MLSGPHPKIYQVSGRQTSMLLVITLYTSWGYKPGNVKKPGDII
jgi:hypothetical protein